MKLPPLPPADLLVECGQSWVEGLTLGLVRDYGQKCYMQALEDAALAVEDTARVVDGADALAAIRALGDV